MSLYAVIKTGGKQYKVSEGDTLRIEKLSGAPGEEISFDEVLMTGGDQVSVGTPLVKGAKVTGKILSQDRAKKIIVFKMKRRKSYRRKQGHRQAFTAIEITKVAAS